jgi:hypothetical protein
MGSGSNWLADFILSEFSKKQEAKQVAAAGRNSSLTSDNCYFTVRVDELIDYH